MNRFRIKNFPIVAVVMLAGAFPLAAVPSDPVQDLEERFMEANQLYEKGLYREAVAEYEAIRQYGIENEKLYYNLGNTYFKTNDLGRSLLNFERAYQIDPGDSEIRENLEFARSLVYDRIVVPPPPFPFKQFLSLHRSISINAETWILLLVYFAASGQMTGFLLATRKEWRKGLLYGMFVSILLCLGLSFSLGMRIHALQNFDEGIIITDTVEVRSGPGDEETVLFTIHEGVKAKVQNERREWTQVSFPNGWNGWIPSDSVEKI
ncbi:MAG: SH3 domain-containing protein [Acidobacteria bacterium]|nr:SH3 domain-containing protein [Acidobacteriota bacterium]